MPAAQHLVEHDSERENIASRIQGLATSRSIVVTEQVVENAQASALLESSGLKPTPRRATLSGIADEISVYEIP